MRRALTGVAPKRMPCSVCFASSRFAAPRKVATKRVAGRSYSSSGRPHLEQAAQVHHADAIGQRERFFLVVRDQHGGDLQLALHLANGAAKLFANLRVQRAEGLVEQQHFGLVREGASDGHALLLAAGELGRQTIVHAFQRDQAQQFLATLAAVVGAHAPHPQRELDVLADGHVAEQRVVLEHEADAALTRRDVRDVVAVQRDAAVIDARQPGNRAQQGALAAAAGAEQHEELALADFQRDVVDDRQVLISFRDLIEGDRHTGPAAYRPGVTRSVLLRL